MAQGIPFDKEKTMQALSKYYKLGMSTTKACRYAGIQPSTVNRWLQDDPTLALQVNVWRSETSLVARENIDRRIRGKDIIVEDIYDVDERGKQRLIDRITKEVDSVPDVGLSQWWLKVKEGREEAEFLETSRTETVTLTYEELMKMQEEQLKQAEKIEESQNPKPGLYEQIGG